MPQNPLDQPTIVTNSASRGVSGRFKTTTALAATALACAAAPAIGLPTERSQAHGDAARPVSATNSDTTSTTAQGQSGSAQPMVTIPTTRLADTRAGIGAADGLTNDEVATIQMTGSVDTSESGAKGRAHVIPAGADAVVLNVTAVAAKENGFFTLWPAGEEQPGTSNVNFLAGETVANGSTVPLSADGKLSVFTRGAADLLLDVSGYYASGTYTPMPAKRLFDSRTTGHAFDSLHSGTASASSANQGMPTAGSITHIDTGAKQGDLVTLNLTTDYASEPGYFSVWSTPSGEDTTADSAPATSTLNYAPGMLVSNTVEVKAGTDGKVSVYSHADASLIVDQTHRIAAVNAANMAVIYDEPVRTYDSRTDDREWSSNPNAPRRWHGPAEGLTGSGLPGGPQDDAQAVIINATVTNASEDGYATFSQFINLEHGQKTSTINYAAGQTRANRVVVPLDLLGYISAYTHNRADIIVDVLGYVPQATTPPVTMTLDYSDEQLYDQLSAPFITLAGTKVLTDMRKAQYLQVSESSLMMPDLGEWTAAGEPAQLIGPPGTEPIDLPVSPTVDYYGEDATLVHYPGIPRVWAEAAGVGPSELHAADEVAVSIRFPVINKKTGKPGHVIYWTASRYADEPPATDEQSAIRKAPLIRSHGQAIGNRRAVSAVPRSGTKLRIVLPNEVSIHSGSDFGATRPPHFNESDDPFHSIRTHLELGDGPNVLIFEVPPVSDFYPWDSRRSAQIRTSVIDTYLVFDVGGMQTVLPMSIYRE